MSTTSSSLNFDVSMPRPYSESWREAYGQTSNTPRFSSYQPPYGEPVVFAFDSISVSGGQNVDTAEYPYGFWSNTRLGEKAHSVKVKGHVIGENYIAQRSKLISAFEVPTDDDIPGFIDLPLWGRFKVVLNTWTVDEERASTGLSDISIEFTRAGYSDAKRLEAAILSASKQNIEGSITTLKNAAAAAFADALEKSCDSNTLTNGFGQITKTLASIIGRIQGTRSVMNGMVDKVNSVTNLIAQGFRSPKELAQAFISSVFSIAEGILEIKNAVAETASYFMGGEESVSSASELFIRRNEKNALMQFLMARNYKLDDNSVTEEQWNTKSCMENLYKVVSFGVCVQLLTELDTNFQTYEKYQKYWKLLIKLEDSIDKESSDIYAAVEECRISCAETLLLTGSDKELLKFFKKEMPLLTLAQYLGCDSEKIRYLNTVSDSFLIKGDIVYV